MMEGERKLATIRRIAAIDPIEGADRIVRATVDGWQLVTAKDNGFKVGDLVVYFEIDAFLPVRPEFEFLREKCFKSTKNLGDGFRLKTIKLRGQVSQGLILPLDDLFPKMGDDYVITNMGGTFVLHEGDDVTEFLGVQKWEKPIPAQLAGTVKGNFPSFIPKTDQERVQNCLGKIKNWIYWNWETEYVEKLPPGVSVGENGTAHDPGGFSCPEIFYIPQEKGWLKKTRILNSNDVIGARCVFEATVKLDGSSMTIYHKDGQIGVCSRNLELKRDMENVFWKAAINSRLLEFLVYSGRNWAIQGELMGPGVQGNREQLTQHRFFVFDIYDIDAQEYMTPNVRNSAAHEMQQYTDHDWEHVPVVDDIALSEDATVEELLKLADAQKSLNHEVAEGIVFKSFVPGGPSFKVISNKFLLQEKD